MNHPTSSTAFVSHVQFKEHVTGRGHPECPERIDAVRRALEAENILGKLESLAPVPCTEKSLLRCHTPAYLATAKRDIHGGSRQLGTGDTTVCKESWDVAMLAAGGVVVAVDAVCGGKSRNAFCAVRPPGHHATPTRGMGFCVFSNIAVAARYAQDRYGIGKVLIVDWDVHHGNGTQDVFYQDDSVFFYSSHQSPWYPGTGMADETGHGKGLGTTLNVPLPAGSGARELLGAARERLLPAADKFRPDLVMISAGFDSRHDDPLGHFRLTDEDFATFTRLAMQIASEHAESRLVSVLEGGYNLDGLGKAAAAHVGALVGD